MSKAHKGFKVKQHKPWILWVSIIMVLLLFWGFFVLGQAYQSYQLMQLDLERATLLSKIDELESRNHTLVKNNAQLKVPARLKMMLTRGPARH